MAPRKQPLLDDCFLHDRDRMRHEEVLALLDERVAAITSVETIPLADTPGRFAAARITAPRNVPLHDNSAVDGYAFRHADYLTDQRFSLGPRLTAGARHAVTLKPGEAARIFTGAAMPGNADTVAMQEDCRTDDKGRVTIPAGLPAGANRRRAGEDLHSAETIIEPGRRIRPQDVAAIASLGITDIAVHGRLRIAVLSSGDELLRPEVAETITPGEVFDSNRPMLAALCRRLPVEISDLGIVEDDAETVRRTLANAAGTHDLILTSGGASRGEEDHMVRALDDLGKRHLWQIAIKPGRPMTFGQIDGCVFLGLPGNPVAAFVCFLLYAVPVIQKLSGGLMRSPLRFPISANFEIARKKTDRREFLRGWIEPDDGGRPVACKFPRDGSGLISGLRRATGLIELPEQLDRVLPGDTVNFIPFSEFGLDSD